MISVRFTGLENLEKGFAKTPRFLEAVVKVALKRSIGMVETEAKRLTPVATGLLRSSIGGVQGYSYVRGLTAGVGTNVQYAIYVEGSDRARHSIGQAHFMEQGVENSRKYIKSEFEKAMVLLANKIVK